MTVTTLAHVRNGFLSADGRGTGQRLANRRRSASLTASDRSQVSRVTLVENDSNLTSEDNSKSDDSYEIISYYPPKYTWVDHLRGFFCLSLSKKKAIMRTKYSRSKTPVGSRSDQDLSTWPSPWILPVYVYPNREDKGSDTVPKVGKCTIDTGNLQGNIVSRQFVERVLEYPPERFHELTKEEMRGGTGITGDLHVPEGAIYLTWYHKNSTRVFRDMRFLISPHSDCDLIIGARSIQKDGILNVPCLMTVPGGRIIHRQDPNQDENYRIFNTEKEAKRNQVQLTITEIIGFTKDDPFDELSSSISNLALCMVDAEFCSLAIQLYDILHDSRNDKETSNQDKRVLARPVWFELSALKERKPLSPESEDVTTERDRVSTELHRQELQGPLQFEILWKNLAAKYALSKDLEDKLKTGKSRGFWEDLQANYSLCERDY